MNDNILDEVYFTFFADNSSPAFGFWYLICRQQPHQIKKPIYFFWIFSFRLSFASYFVPCLIRWKISSYSMTTCIKQFYFHHHLTLKKEAIYWMETTKSDYILLSTQKIVWKNNLVAFYTFQMHWNIWVIEIQNVEYNCRVNYFDILLHGDWNDVKWYCRHFPVNKFIIRWWSIVRRLLAFELNFFTFKTLNL